MNLLNEVANLLESALGKKIAKANARELKTDHGKAKTLKTLGFDFEDGKGFEDYLEDMEHWRKLVDKKGFQSVIAGLETSIKVYSSSHNPNKNIKLANKIEILTNKIRKMYNKDDSDPKNDKEGKFDRNRK